MHKSIKLSYNSQQCESNLRVLVLMAMVWG